MTFKEAIATLAKELSIENWEPKESGRFVAGFDGGLVLELSEGKERETLLLSGQIARFDDSTTKEDLVKILQLNGPAMKYYDDVLTLDREENALVLQRTLGLKYIQESVFIRGVEQFLNNLEFWVKLTRTETLSPESDAPFMILP